MRVFASFIIRCVCAYTFVVIFLYADNAPSTTNEKAILQKTQQNIDQRSSRNTQVKDSKREVPMLVAKPLFNGATFILSSKNQIEIFDDDTPIQWLDHPKDKQLKIAFFPISYHQKSAKTFYTEGKIPIMRLPVEPKKYPSEKINIPLSKISYDDATDKRIKEERNDILRIYSTITKKRYWNDVFIKPVDSEIINEYGRARFFNGIFQSFHTGTDFRAGLRTPVKATNNGRVVLVQDRFLAGKSIVIDHGYGIYSVYHHLEDFRTKVGAYIKRGQVIGLSGNTGRSNGPHVHFGIVINGVNVDPMDFLNKTNELFDK